MASASKSIMTALVRSSILLRVTRTTCWAFRVAIKWKPMVNWSLSASMTCLDVLICSRNEQLMGGLERADDPSGAREDFFALPSSSQPNGADKPFTERCVRHSEFCGCHTKMWPQDCGLTIRSHVKRSIEFSGPLCIVNSRLHWPKVHLT